MLLDCVVPREFDSSHLIESPGVDATNRATNEPCRTVPRMNCFPEKQFTDTYGAIGVDQLDPNVLYRPLVNCGC